MLFGSQVILFNVLILSTVSAENNMPNQREKIFFAYVKREQYSVFI